jgi:hypothetical protein
MDNSAIKTNPSTSKQTQLRNPTFFIFLRMHSSLRLRVFARKLINKMAIKTNPSTSKQTQLRNPFFFIYLRKHSSLRLRVFARKHMDKSAVKTNPSTSKQTQLRNPFFSFFSESILLRDFASLRENYWINQPKMLI